MLTPIKTALLEPLMDAQTTASGTDSDTFGRVAKNYGHKGLLIYVPRSADSGTCTATFYVQGLIPGGDETDDNDFFDVAGALVTYADGETGTYVGKLYPGLTAQDGGVDTIMTTTGKKVFHASGYLPDVYRLRLRNGGTTVTNTIGDVVGVPLP